MTKQQQHTRRVTSLADWADRRARAFNRRITQGEQERAKTHIARLRDELHRLRDKAGA
jgi:hypothetical protein